MKKLLALALAFAACSSLAFAVTDPESATSDPIVSTATVIVPLTIALETGDNLDWGTIKKRMTPGAMLEKSITLVVTGDEGDLITLTDSDGDGDDVLETGEEAGDLVLIANGPDQPLEGIEATDQKTTIELTYEYGADAELGADGPSSDGIGTYNYEVTVTPTFDASSNLQRGKYAGSVTFTVNYGN